MGLFSGIRDAKVGAGGVYFLAGLYKVEIIKVMTLNSRKKEDLFIVEAKILESDNNERRAGSQCSWVVNLKQDAALGNIKGFIAASNDIDPSNEDEVNNEVTEDAVEFACSNDNPLKGAVLRLECVAIKTRAGGDFTLHKWAPL